MKIKQAHLRNGADFSALDGLTEVQPQVVLAFGGSVFFQDGLLGKRLREKFPDALIAGCSSAGEIVNDSAVYDDTLVVTALHEPNTTFFIASAKVGSADNSFSAGHALGRELAEHHVDSVFILAPGLDINGSALSDGVAAALGSDVVVTGGLAGDGPRFQKTYTLCDDAISSDTAVAIGQHGGSLAVSYGSAGGWEPFGPERRVTRAVRNVLYELDGKPALELYKEYLGEKARELPASGLLYPFSIKKEGGTATTEGIMSGGLTRTILNIDEKNGSLVLAGDMPEGSMVRLMHAKTGGLVNGAIQASKQACDAVSANAPCLGILVSCIGRKLVMGHDVDEEVGVVKSALGPKAVITGFYSYGEICAMGKNDRKPCLHNQTMTITRVGANAKE